MIGTLLWMAVLAYILYRFIKNAAPETLARIGAAALAKQPLTITMTKQGFAGWRDPGRVSALAAPLLSRGFADLGVYVIDQFPDSRMWVLLNEREQMAAYLYEHPQIGPWLELSTRYKDGSMTMVVNRPSMGIIPPPFVRRLEVPPATPAGEMADKMLSTRSNIDILPVTPANVLEEFAAAWKRIMLWKKEHGISPQEVAGAAHFTFKIKKGA